ncbi:MAG: response regulator [Lachnospiraceae bacterium]|nr:response regulator [Lachnospiraceae bacterium]
MDTKEQFKELIEQNEKRVNTILSRGNLAFLILCPVIILVTLSGVLVIPRDQMVGVVTILALLALVPAIVCPRVYHESTARIVVLTAMEVTVCILGLNPIFSVSMLYLLVPLVSLMYLKKDVFLAVARNCFFAMLITELLKFLDLIRNNEEVTLGSVYRQSYDNLIPVVFGYVLVMLVMYFLYGWIYSLMLFVLNIEKEQQPVVRTVAEPEEKEAESITYNVKGLFLSINQTVQGLIRGKDKTLAVNVDYNLPAALKGNPEQIKLAIVSILSDFLQFTDEGTVTLSVTYEKGIVPRKGQNITIICRILCSEDLTEKVRDGITMGLALAKNVIGKMGGVILDKSFGTTLTQTCYTVSFLQEVAEEETLGMLKQKNRDEQEALISISRKREQNLLQGREVKALIVDDSKENIRLVSAILKSFGVKSQGVTSGQEAIERLYSKGIDFVIIDHMMPGKSGIQTAKEIRQIDDPYFELLPLMVMSSNITDEFRQIFAEAGFAEIISKPIKEEELRLAISRIYLS